jgi:hypothetical protein
MSSGDNIRRGTGTVTPRLERLIDFRMPARVTVDYARR